MFISEVQNTKQGAHSPTTDSAEVTDSSEVVARGIARKLDDIPRDTMYLGSIKYIICNLRSHIIFCITFSQNI